MPRTQSGYLLKKKKTNQLTKNQQTKVESSPVSIQLVHEELLPDASHNQLRNILYHLKRVLLKTFRVPVCKSPSCEVGQLGKAKVFLFFVYIMQMYVQVYMWLTCSSFLYIITSLSYSDSRKTLLHIFVFSHFLHIPERMKNWFMYAYLHKNKHTQACKNRNLISKEIKITNLLTF